MLSTPGTGKTPIAVRALRETPGAFPALVVGPSSTLSAWLDALARWAPDLRVCVLDGTPKTTARRPAHVYLTTWALLDEWAPRLEALALRSIVFDEVHQVRHLDTIRAGAAARLAAGVPFLVGLTGTPIVTSTDDLDAILSLWAGGAAPVRIRRLLEDVAPEVPPKSRSTLFVQLRPADRARYQEAEDDLAAYLTRIGKLPHEVARAMYAEAFVKINVCRRLLEQGKVWAAADWVARAVLVGEPVVLFFDTLEALRRFRRLLRALRVRSLVIEGKTSRRARTDAIRAFQGRAVPVLCCTRAGIEGITLTAARYCVHVGRYWNSTDEDQASDRLHRIGQRHPVTAVFLHAVDTLDDRLAAIVDQKAELVAGAVSTSPVEERVIGELLRGWGVLTRAPVEPSALGLGALPPPLPLPHQVHALDFSRRRWSEAAAIAWCRMHGYRPTGTAAGERSIRVVCGPPGRVIRLLSTDIRAIVTAA